MVTFYLSTNSDRAYTVIMEYIIAHSLTFSKDTSSGPAVIEIEGNVHDYAHFKNLIETNQLYANLQEAL